MFRKNYFTFLWVTILSLSSAFSVFAQTAPIGGRVELKKADGTVVGVQGALVEVFRTDIKANFPSAKTDKKGNFSFAGLPVGATFVLSVSAAGAKPGFLPDVKAGMEKLLVSVTEGDGKRWTEQEIRDALTAPAASETPQKAAQMTAEQKKAEEQYQKEVAAITAKNEKNKNVNAVVQKVLNEGGTALKEKNYDLALSKFDEGITAEPNFAGITPVLLNARAVTLKERGFASYAQGAKSADAALKASMFESAKKDWTAALDSLAKGLTILKAGTAPDAAAQKNYDITKLNLLQNSIEAHRLLNKTGIDRTKSADAKVVYEQYFEVETDAALKSKAQLTLGDIMREAGDFDNAVLAYRKMLETSPDNPDALAGLGLSLFAAGAGAQPENIAQEQEGLNYLQRFTEVAPENHPLKTSVKESVDYLKSKALTPQKTNKTGTKRKT